MRKCFILLLALLLLCSQAAAYEIPEDLAGRDLESVVAEFMEGYGLRDGNFSLSYYNTVTGESYAIYDTTFMVAASTFKLPLNMYYYEMEQRGEIEPDAFIPSAGVALDVAHRESLVNSNNEFSIGLLYNLGDFRTYKTLLREAYFTMPEEEIDYIYYADNYYCTNMMMDALKYLYDHSEDFEEMIGYMKQAQPDSYFRAGVTEYEVAHKYGWFDGAVNDVGIFYTEEPFLLAVYTQDVYGEGIVADAAALMTAYNVANLTPEAPAAPEEEPLPEETVTLEIEMVPVEETEEIPEPQPEPPVPEESEPIPEQPAPEVEAETKPAFEWWMIGVALLVFLLGSGGTLLVFNNKHLKKMKLDEEEEETVP